MKLHVAGALGVVVMAVFSAGCIDIGPGLSHRVKTPVADVATGDVGTTTISSETRFLPHTLDPSPWDEPPVKPAAPTWGTGVVEPTPAAPPENPYN